jgi:hypothetical protein
MFGEDQGLIYIREIKQTKNMYIVYSTSSLDSLHISTRAAFDELYAPNYEGVYPYNSYEESDLELARANAAELVQDPNQPYYGYTVVDHTL